MTQEHEQPKEPANPVCHYCGEGKKATWKVITKDKNEEYVCADHLFTLRELKVLRSEEEIRMEAEWRMENELDEKMDDFKDADEWEDVDNWIY